MKITWRTKTKDILPLLTKERLDELFEKIPEVEYKSIIAMTISEFGELIMDEEQYVYENIIKKNKRFLAAFGKIKHLKGQLDGLNNFIGKYNNRQLSQEEKAAQKGILYPSFIQRVLLDLVEFFSLKSFDDAEKMKLSDWLLVYQNKAAESLYNYNYQRILEQKSKMKPKKK